MIKKHRLLITILTGGGSTSFSDDFNRADGAIGGEWTGANYTIASNAAICTPTLGSTKLVNGNMETGDPPTNWTAQGSATLDGVADERTGGAGAQSMEITRGSTTNAAQKYSTDTVVGRWYQFSAWLKNVDATNGIRAGSDNDTALARLTLRTGTSWVQGLLTYVATQTSNPIYASVSGSAGQKGRIDDVLLQEITLSTAIASREFSGTVYQMGVDVTLSSIDQKQAGVIACLDSSSSPANFVLCYIDATKIYIDKYVAGVRTNVLNAAITYSAGQTVELRRNGNTFGAYYNSVQKGTDVTISDAGIVSNTLGGMFSTTSGNILDEFFFL